MAFTGKKYIVLVVVIGFYSGFIGFFPWFNRVLEWFYSACLWKSLDIHLVRYEQSFKEKYLLRSWMSRGFVS